MRKRPPTDVTTPRDLYTGRAGLYSVWMKLFRHQQALRSLFEISGVLRSDLRILDAGCGSGATTLALISALRHQGYDYCSIDGFDLTPAMLNRFRNAIRWLHLERVELKEANVLTLQEQLPDSWTSYDLVVCTSMLEYLPPGTLEKALASLRQRLNRDGALLVVVTKKTTVAKVMVEVAWRARAYGADELRSALRSAGFSQVVFHRFPARFFWMNTTNHVVTCGDGAVF